MGLMREYNSFNYKLDCFILSRCIYGSSVLLSSANYNQCKIASEQNHLTVFRLITGEVWMYWRGSMFQSTAPWPRSPGPRCLVSPPR